MIDGLSVLGLIPARGGSKGVPKKNIHEVGGKPLIAWTIEAASQSEFLDRTILSSDDTEIIETARSWKCDIPFTRPDELAADTSDSLDVAIHAIHALDDAYDLLVLLQPTSPLRSFRDIDAAISLSQKHQAPCVSVCKTGKSPSWMFTLDKNDAMHPVFPDSEIQSRRQDAPMTVIPNGAVYVSSCTHLLDDGDFFCPETVAYLMPEERSIDVDSEIDLRMADMLLKDSRHG